MRKLLLATAAIVSIAANSYPASLRCSWQRGQRTLKN
jgi:hypothetical protein